MRHHEGGDCWKFCLTGSSRRAVVTVLSLLCTKYKTLSKMLGDRWRQVIGQAKQIHQSCCLPGRSVMNNLSRMTDVLDVHRNHSCNWGLPWCRSCWRSMVHPERWALDRLLDIINLFWSLQLCYLLSEANSSMHKMNVSMLMFSRLEPP